jgi:hypothetical protein
MSRHKVVISTDKRTVGVDTMCDLYGGDYYYKHIQEPSGIQKFVFGEVPKRKLDAFWDITDEYYYLEMCVYEIPSDDSSDYVPESEPESEDNLTVEESSEMGAPDPLSDHESYGRYSYESEDDDY